MSAAFLPPKVRSVLDRVARKDFQFRVVRFPLLASIVLPAFWILEALIDLVFNLSWGSRLGFLLVSGAFVGWLFYRHVVVPVRRRMNLRASALLVERKFPQFRSSLISAVDFSGKELAQDSAGLVQLLVGQVSRLVDRTQILRGVVDTRPVRRMLFIAIGVVIVTAGLVWFFQPQSLVLARRVFLSNETLPSRTTVVPLSGDFTLNTGSNVELSARAQGVIPRNGRLIVVYADGRQEAIPVSVSTTETGVFRITLRNVLQSFRYHFELNDGVSSEFAVKTRTLPSLATTKFIYLPPSYTGRPETELPAGSLTLLAGSRLVIQAEATQTLKSAILELKGLDQTLQLDNGNPADNLRIRITANEAKAKELEARIEKLRPDAEAANAFRDKAKEKVDAADKTRQAAQGDERRRLDFKWELAAGALREAQGEAERANAAVEQSKRELEEKRRQTEEQKKQLAAAPTPSAEELAKQKRIVRADIPIPKEGLTGLSIHLTNEEGLASENDPVYRVNITNDKPPTAEIVEPKSERKTVLAGDKVLIKYRARDDYKLEKVALRYVVLRSNADGEVVPAGEGEIPLNVPVGSTTLAGTYLWDLGSFQPLLIEGSSLSYWLEARDHFTLYVSPTNVPISRKMIIAVVSPEEKKAEFIAEMEKAAKEIERLSESQRKANEKTDANLRK